MRLFKLFKKVDKMKVLSTRFQGLKLIKGKSFYDKRGYFREIHRSSFFKKKKLTIKTQGYIHNVITAVPTEYFFRSGSPDELLIHGESQSEILTRYLEWPKNRIKLIKSFMTPLKKDEYFQYIYLPFQIENFNSVFILFENLIINSTKNHFKNLKVKILR